MKPPKKGTIWQLVPPCPCCNRTPVESSLLHYKGKRLEVLSVDPLWETELGCPGDEGLVICQQADDDLVVHSIRLPAFLASFELAETKEK